MHAALSQEDMTRQPFPERSEALRAAKCFHRDSTQHNSIKNEIADKEDELDTVEEEERREFMSGIEGGEDYYVEDYDGGGLGGDY